MDNMNFKIHTDPLDELFYKNHPLEIEHPLLVFGEQKWAGLDSKELWDQLLEKGHSDNYNWRRNNLKVSIADFNWKEFIQYYTDNPIHYSFNSEGFRDEEWSKKPKEVDVFLGCSFTVGTGLHYEHTWPYKVQQHTQFPSLNAAIGGSGPITHYRVLMHLIKRFKIRRVYHYMPIKHARYEWHTLEGWQNLTTGTNFNPKLDFLFSAENISVVNTLCLNATQQICTNNNIDYNLLFRIPHHRPNPLGIKKPLVELIARDWHHSGWDYQEDIANYFINPKKNPIFS